MIEDNNTEIGNILQKYRKTKRISLKDISERTHISVETLEKLEAGDFNEIPELYLKNFIKRYATALGLNSHSTIHDYLNAETRKDQIPIISKKKRNTPVNIILKIMIPLLICIAGIQLYVLNIQSQREMLRISNKGEGEIVVNDGISDIILGSNESIDLNSNYKVHIFNEENSLIVVKYYDDTWEVFFEEFEVQLTDGTD